MTLPLRLFLEYASYNRIHTPFYVTNVIAEAIKADADSIDMCVIEQHNHETSMVWYPKSAHVLELQRRNDVALEIPRLPVVETESSLRKQLVLAAQAGNFHEVNMLTEKLKKIKSVTIQ